MICFGAGLAGEHAPAEQEPVLHVGAVDEVPRHLGQLLRLELAGDLAEADDAEEVARELRRDQRVQRHRDLLGREEVVAHRHRQRQVEHEHGARLGERLGALDLEVVGLQAHRRAAALALDGVAHGALDVEVERVAELVGLGLVGALVADAGALDLVAADAVLGELVEQVGQRVLADAPHAAGRELEAALLLLDEPGLLEHLGQLGQPLEAAGRVVAEQVPRRVEVDLGQRAG